VSWLPPSANSSGRYLIASGTADYDFLPENAQLSQVHGAVDHIVNLFTQHLGYTRVLADELGSGGINPSVEELRRELAAWFGAPERSPEDLVTVYYTGHGASEGSSHYLYGRDTKEVGSLAGFALRSGDLADFIAASPVQHALVLLDTCFSGAGAGEAAARAQELSRSLRVDEQRGSGLLFVASARPKDEAEQAVFAEALSEVVLHDDSVAGSLVPYLHPDEVVDGINRLFEGRGLQQRARLNAANVSRPAGLLPNPRYLSGRHMDFVGHWDPHARGVQPDQASRRASYFTGRTFVLDKLAAYLTGSEPDTRMRVITGDPGCGKSAVLARLVVLSDPEWRRQNLSVGDRQFAGADGLGGTIDLAVHARGKTLPELTEELGSVIGIAEREPRLLVEAIRRRAEPLVIVVDALDEAQGDTAAARELLRPLSGLPNIRLVVGSRRQLCASLGLARVDLDLDEPQYQDADEIKDYVSRLLLAREDPELPTPYRGKKLAAEQAAAAVAQRANLRDSSQPCDRRFSAHSAC
jgi:hypothetical protein